MKKIYLFLISLIFIGYSINTFADYPIVGYSYLADPGAIWHEGRLYVYCSNDNENPIGGASYKMSTIVCVSSADLKNWTNHGVVLDTKNVSWSGLSWAPSPAYKNGKFYLYYGNGGSAIGVAVSDSPTGPFVDPLGRSLASGNTPGVQPFDGWLFDPMTFIDDDGEAYMYFGGNGDNNMRVAHLNSDMISINGNVGKINVPNLFEAAWLHKYNGTYYFSYSTNPSNGMRIDYMTSNNPMTGFTYGGIISNQPPINNNNNHQAIVEIEGEWYQVYHNRIVARDNLGTAEMPYHRNLAIDKFTHNGNGTINKMVNTVDGVKQLKYLDPFVRVEAETMSNQKGIDVEVCSAGGMNLAFIDNNDWTMVEGVNFGTAGARSFTASVASDKTGGSIEIRLGSTNGTLVGTLQVPNTGGFQNWQEESVTINTVTGIHNVYFVFKGNSASLFNVDHWKFEEAAGAPKISIVSPMDGDSLFTGEDVTIDASVSDEDGTITNVFYYVNDQLVQEEWVAPYAFNYVFQTAGVYKIKAVATDNDGNTKEDIISVKVFIPQAPFKGINNIPGRIEAEDYDVGGQGFAHNDIDAINEGNSDYRAGDGVDVEETQDIEGEYNVGYIRNGEWLEYTIEVASDGMYDLDLRMATEGDGKSLHIEVDGQNVSGPVAVPNTEGWQIWGTTTVEDLNLTAGTHVLRLVFDSDYMNLNYMEFRNQVVTSLNNSEVTGIEIYPNPFNNAGIKLILNGSFQYEISDIKGARLEFGKGEDNVLVGRSLEPGIYFITIHNNIGSETKRVIKF